MRPSPAIVLLSAALAACAGKPGQDLTPTLVTLGAPPIAAPLGEQAEDPAPTERASGWSLFHGDIARTGRADAPPITRPRLRWRADVGIMGWLNAPVLAGPLVVVPSSGREHNEGDDRDGVYAFELASGKRLWHSLFPNDANGAAVAGDRVIATCDDGHVYALELTTGRVMWKRKGEGKMYSSPLPLGDRVVVGDATGHLYAFALQDGSPLWSAQLDGALRGGASSDGERVYAVSQRGEAVALDPTGTVRWRKKLEYAPDSPIEAYAAPIVTTEALIIPYARDTYYEHPAIIALSKRSGVVLWKASAQGSDWGNIRATPALAGETLVYAEPYSGDVVGIASRTGKVRYRKTVGPCFFPQWAAPAAARGTVYVPRFDGALYAVNAAEGKLLWQLYLGEASLVGSALPPAFSQAPHGQGSCAWDVPVGAPLYAPPAIAEDGTLLVGSGEGKLYAITDVGSN